MSATASRSCTASTSTSSAAAIPSTTAALTFTSSRGGSTIRRELGLDARFFHTNHEGEFVEQLHRARGPGGRAIVNPGAWTHYAGRSATRSRSPALPAVEVHLSDVIAREEWRRVSVISDLCIATVCGQGLEGYREALERAQGRSSAPMSSPPSAGRALAAARRRARARRAARHRPRQHPLAHGLHGLERRGRGRPGACGASSPTSATSRRPPSRSTTAGSGRSTPTCSSASSSGCRRRRAAASSASTTRT